MTKRHGAGPASYLHELLFLLLPAADGVSDGAHLLQDGLCLLLLVAMRTVGHLLVDPAGRGGHSVLVVTVFCQKVQLTWEKKLVSMI